MSDASLSTGDRDVVDLVERILKDRGDPGNDRSGRTEQSVWAALVGSELHLLGLPEAAGGAGGDFQDVAAVAMTCAKYGLAVPLVENHVSEWVRAAAGKQVTRGVSIVCTATSDSDGKWVIADVPWSDQTTSLLIRESETSDVAFEVAIEDLDHRDRSVDLAGHCRQSYVLSSPDRAQLPRVAVDTDGLATRAMLLRTAQLAGAIQGCFEMSRSYAATRRQFGRPIVDFHAVQRHLVELAQATAITQVAVWRAVATLSPTRTAAADSAYAAKSICNHYAREALRCAHQVHGAIGMTREYPLHRLTTQLHLWRLTDGAAERPEQELGDRFSRGRDFLELVWAPR